MDYTLVSKGLRLVPQELASKWSFDTSLCIGHGEVMVPKTANESSAVSSVRQINTAEGTYASSWDSLRSGLGKSWRPRPLPGGHRGRRVSS